MRNPRDRVAGRAWSGWNGPITLVAEGTDAKLQAQLEALVKAGHPGVVASVTGRDGTTEHYTAGVSNLQTPAQVPPDPHVRIASNTRTFTATVVLQLVAEGTIDLDAPIETSPPGLVRGAGPRRAEPPGS